MQISLMIAQHKGNIFPLCKIPPSPVFKNQHGQDSEFCENEIFLWLLLDNIELSYFVDLPQKRQIRSRFRFLVRERASKKILCVNQAFRETGLRGQGCCLWGRIKRTRWDLSHILRFIFIVIITIIAVIVITIIIITVSDPVLNAVTPLAPWH